MNELLTAFFAAGGVFLGRFLMRTSREREVLRAPAAPAKGDEEPREEKKDEPTEDEEASLFSSFPCRLGDVVVRLGAGEAWLSGALVFSESVPTAALFVAPERAKDRAVFVRAAPSATLVWLEPLAAGEVVCGAEPPTTLEHAGARFERVRRLPLHVRRLGNGAPDVGDRALVAEYSSGDGQRLVLVVGAGPARAWKGLALEPGTYDILPRPTSELGGLGK